MKHLDIYKNTIRSTISCNHFMMISILEWSFQTKPFQYFFYFRFDLRIPIRYIPQNVWPIKSTPTFEQDATPEYIAVSSDNKYAYIILQVWITNIRFSRPLEKIIYPNGRCNLDSECKGLKSMLFKLFVHVEDSNLGLKDSKPSSKITVHRQDR